jgi:hypothetical protein
LPEHFDEMYEIKMYVKHSQLKLNYSDSDKIWRYIDLNKFKSLIKTSSLFFCRADKFHDKWEGVFPIRMIQKFELDKKAYPSSNGRTYTACEWQIQKEARSHLINCWHANKSESFAMWKIYSKPNEPSIAIQSTIGRLKLSFNMTKERIWIGEVEYIDFKNWEPQNRFFNVGTPSILKAFFLKWNYFAYENEIRAIINKSYQKHKSEKGIFIKFNLSELIENIYLSSDFNQVGEKKISGLIEKYSYPFPIKKSDLGMRLYM